MNARIQSEQRKRIRALIVDDDPVMRSLLAAQLADRVSEITEADDGWQGWDLLQNRTFELAFIDLSMPGMDGFSLIQCVRGHPRTKHMPVVVITSSNDPSSIERALDAGATSFLAKPVNWGLFGHHIDYLIRLSQSGNIARSTMHQAEAISRAKDAVIMMLTTRIKAHMANIIAAAETEQASESATATGSGLPQSVLNEAYAIMDICDGTLPHLRSVAEQIVADDRLVPLERIIDSAIGHVESLAMSRNIEIEAKGFDHLFFVRCDEKALARAFGNLLRNAVQFSPEGSSVTIIAQQRGDNALAILIVDRGIGADPADIAACLRPLDHLSETGDVERPGAGLGLPIAKAIAQAHGGTLEVMTSKGDGTTATIVLPSEIVEPRQEEAA